MNYIVFGTNKVSLMVAIMKKVGISHQVAMHNGFSEKYIEDIHKYSIQSRAMIFLLPLEMIGKVKLIKGDFVPFKKHLTDYGVFLINEKRTKPINQDDIDWLNLLLNSKITWEQFLKLV